MHLRCRPSRPSSLALRAASVGLVLTAGQQTLVGALQLPYFLMIALFSFTIFGSVEAINDAAHILSVTDSVLDRLEELERTDFIDKDGREITPKRFDVALSHVSFGYGQREVLHDVTFTAPQGTTTAIVGPSGSGKSTICNLVARFYDTDSGTVSVGGHDVREFTCESLLRNISMVFQNVYLFQDSVENNIKFGCPGATHEQVVEAAKKACCHDFISALPDGYGTVIGEGGATLSGGEKQRIACASAWAMGPEVFVLDEPSSNLDGEGIRQLREILKQLKAAGKTILVAEHRLWYAADLANRVFYLREGRLERIYTGAEFLALPEEKRRSMGLRSLTEVPLPEPHPSSEAGGLTVRGLRASYGGRTVWQDVSFTAPRGQITAITGHNGAGKTTLARCLCGLMKEQAGTILWDESPLGRKERRRKAFLIMQDVNLQLFGDSVLAEARLGSTATEQEALAAQYRTQAETALSGQSELLEHSNALAEDISAAKSRLAALGAEREAAASRAAELRRLAEDLTGGRAQKEEMVEACHQTILQSQAEIARLREETAALETQGQALRQRLAELGFVVGETVVVVSELGGNLILNVKESRVALDKTMAMRIMV